MAFPVRTMTRSSLLSGQQNGRLDSGILMQTPGAMGGATVTLVTPAARAWRALCAAAKVSGHTLKATSVADSYRIYEIQERIFRDRYTTTYLVGRPYKYWNGRRWYQRPGTAVAAVPGTSNHGWASAVDTGEERDSDTGAESLDDPTLRWLLDHEQTYGWSHEVQSEPWHIRYFAGDAIPQAVLAYEAAHDPEEDELNDADRKWIAGQLDAHRNWVRAELGTGLEASETSLLRRVREAVDAEGHEIRTWIREELKRQLPAE
jgi:hypothetical protein